MSCGCDKSGKDSREPDPFTRVTPACAMCCRKHLLGSSAYQQESLLGHPDHILDAIGELLLAEREIVGLSPQIANAIRIERHRIEGDSTPGPAARNLAIRLTMEYIRPDWARTLPHPDDIGGTLPPLPVSGTEPL